MNDVIQIEVSNAALACARNVLLAHPPSTVAHAIARASIPLPGLSDEQGARLTVSPRMLGSPAQFDVVLARVLPGYSQGDRNDLWGLLTQTPALLPAHEVLLQRALTPLSGLLSYPPEILFSAGELAQIHATPRPEASAPLTRAAVTGILKVTRLCNLRCTYCHDWREGAEANMPFNVRLHAIAWLIGGSRARNVNVLLHGGEPTLMGARELLRLLMLQAHWRAPGQHVSTRLQTNATRLSPEFVRILSHFDISVSVSLDGPPEVHDQTRNDVRGKPSSERVLSSIHHLRGLGLFAGVLVVVTPTLIAAGAERLIEFLRDEGITTVGLLAMRPAAGPAPSQEDYLPTSDYCRFLLAAHRARIRLAPSMKLREVDAPLSALAGGCAGTCELQGSCVGSYFGIEPNGNVMHCDKYVGDQEYVLGTVFEGFEAVAHGGKAQSLASRAFKQKQLKKNCPWSAQCKGWCPHEDYVSRAMGAPDTNCCGLADLFAGLAAMSGRTELSHG
jgi:uncharacterized protein